jgi:GntR family transcriptional regulator, histidine utilization repressor
VTGKSATLHERIVTEVRDRIRGGFWPPGHRIPFETDMATEYGVSRMTVNKALTQLTREGFLDRRRKGGTFVARPRHESAVMTIPDIGEEVRGRDEAYAFETIARVVRSATAEDRALLRSDAPSLRVLAIESVHSADGLPFCHEARLINLDAVPEAEAADFGDEPPGSWLLRMVPWSSAEQRIRAVVPTPRLERLLRASQPAACLEIERRTELEGRAVTFARLTYRGDMHQLVAEFAPGGSGLTGA